MSLHRLCDLPGTHDLQKKVNMRKAEIAAEKTKVDAEKAAAGGEEVKVAGRSKRKGTEETQAASGLKRRRVVVEVEPWNKPQELTEGEFRLRVVELMGMLVDEVNGVRHGLSLHNVLQQRSLCAREGLVPKGDLPVETFVYDSRVRVGVSTKEIPPPSCVLSEGGVEGVLTKETPPPSRVSSKGGGGNGGGGVSSTEKLPPLRLVFQVREGWRWCWWCVDRENTPSVSCFERGRGWRWWCVDRETTLLRLAFRAREGVKMVVVVCRW